MGVVFAKTAKGLDEMVNRSGQLSPRVRRVLIFVDGKRPVESIRDMVHADDLTHTLGELEEQGYIEVIGVSEGGAPVAPVETPLPAITAFRPLPATPVTKELDMAKNFIMNTLRTFCGPYEHLGLVKHVFDARSHEALRQHFDEWYRCIVDTSQGRRRAEELRSELLKVI